MKKFSRTDAFNQPPGRALPVFTPNSPVRSFAEYVAWVNRKLPMDFEKRKGVLFGCAGIARTIGHDVHFTPEGVTISGIGTALLTLKALIGHRYPLLQPDTPSVDEFVNPALEIVKEAEGVHTDHFVLAERAGQDGDLDFFKQQLKLTWNWTLCSNAQYQGNAIYQIANALVLTGLEGFGSLPVDSASIEKLFQNEIDISAKEFFNILFGLWAISSNGVILHVEKIYEKNNGNLLALESIKKVVGDLSFRLDSPLGSPEFSGYKDFSGKMLAEAIFSRTPLIQISDKHYLFAGHPFLKIQMTSKFLQKTLAFARKQEGKPSTDFSQFIGERLEKFFGELCAVWNPSEGAYDEYSYLKNRNEKGPDKIVFEKQATKEVVTLFQMKTKMLKETTHYGVSESAHAEDVDPGFAEMIGKSIDFLFRLEEALKLNKVPEEHIALSKRILAAKKISLVGLSPDLPPIFVSPHYREALINKVKASLELQVWHWFDKRYQYKKTWFWHILDLEEFETFLSSPSGKKNFFDEVSQFVLQSRADSLFVDKKNTHPENFRSFIIKRHARKEPGKGEERYLHRVGGLEEIFNKTGNEIGKYFFPDAPPFKPKAGG